ncbi:type II toxin-antitoxin system RatA family toxin [Kitasatospora purpeofusca]|uniref:type II toxin-antitoxin system RatA family toxin n=1 Tax=Kitasatospora purpeofusca TaxID=67352 RepID=UPI00225C3ADC|nr:SRPBCC family protein [Kitasatospora purpeofusca]MCX4690681.1 SRPBCC family protein [Kitasatospora purpeofusca]
MRDVRVEAVLTKACPLEVFEKLKDFESYADHTSAVRSVVVTTEADGTRTSDWTVAFRNGEMHWTERDIVDQQALTLTFDQVDGDFERFSGVWQVTPAGQDTTVAFAAAFDLGMPSLDYTVGPLAEQALQETVTAILLGVLGNDLVIDSGDNASPTLG